jgi:hypothetical protein
MWRRQGGFRPGSLKTTKNAILRDALFFSRRAEKRAFVFGG